MGVFDRFRRVLKSHIGSLLSRAENPEKMLNQIIIDMNAQLLESKKSVAASIADERRLERQMNDYVYQLGEWEKKAVLALKENREDLAKEALLRKQEVESVLLQQKVQLEAQHASVETLKSSLRALQQKVLDAQRKKNLLIARAKRAAAEKHMQSTISSMNDSSAFQAFDRMSEKVDQIEAEVDALAEMETTLQEASLEEKFKELEESSRESSADKLLEDLKRKLLEEGK